VRLKLRVFNNIKVFQEVLGQYRKQIKMEMLMREWKI